LFRKKIRNGGFVLVEFAIALPLLILLMYGLAIVSMKIFSLGKEQLADYVLEAEAQYVMELITREARVAKEVEIHNENNKIKIVYHAVDDWYDSKDNGYYHETLKNDNGAYYQIFGARDILETQFIFPYLKEGREYPNLYAQRQEDFHTSPITGENSFGDTQLVSLKYDLDESKKILHIKLEMESLVTGHKIKIATAVFMPNYGE
jgi:hypothetical protein